MRIISWNCHQSFRTKFHILDKYDADILVVQECETPFLSDEELGAKKREERKAYLDYIDAFPNKLWCSGIEGDEYDKDFVQITNGKPCTASKARGLGIFAREGIKLEKLNVDLCGFKQYLPCRVNDSFDLLGVWTKSKGYIEEFYMFSRVFKDYFNSNMVVIGDFNSSRNFDKKHDERTHTRVVERMKNIGLVSAYHSMTNEQQGLESIPTFFQNRKNGKIQSYHLDYCFVNENDLVSASFLTRDDITLRFCS